jgi:arginyl-tRNA synthetase
MEIFDPLEVYKKEVLDSLRGTLTKLGYEGAEPELETPPEDLGDISFSCFSLAKVAKKPPQEIAKEIAENLTPMENIEKWENVGAHVNFHINTKKLAEMTLKTVLGLKDRYGDSPPRNEKIVLEHTSANPTDKLHIGRARNPIIGDTLARILRKAGYEVETQYYVDDMGMQAVTLSYGIDGPKDIPSSDVERVKKLREESLGPYQFGSTIVQNFDWAKEERDEMLKQLERGEEGITSQVMRVTDQTMEEKIKPTLERINVKVDHFIHESKFLKPTKEIAEILKESALCDQEEGAYYLDLSEFGVEKKFFFVRADGTTLYATRDIAYHLWKAERGDVLINILGEDHKLEAKYVAETLKNVLKKEVKIESIFYSFVSLPEGRMSTRKGKVVFMDDLLGEALERAEVEVKKRRPDISDDRIKKIAEIVGIGAVRYNLVNVQPEKKIVFRWENALNFEGDSAPFIQYAHARASSILRKAEAQGIERFEDYDPTFLKHASEVKLIKEMAKFPESVRKCAKKRRPHAIASYAFGLASLFNEFYRDCPVLASEDDSLRKARLALVDSAKTVLSNSLFCLGIEAPEEM